MLACGQADQPHGLRPGDEVVITEMEHHSNIVPWQLVTQRTGATLRWLNVDDDGRLDLSQLDEVINERTKVVSLVHVSNALGTLNPVEVIAERAHEVGALVVVDASQSVPQMPVDVSQLGADFVAFTGHKMCGPTGIGVLWGRYDLLAALPPFLGGGEMIEVVEMTGSTYAPPPHRFEAGTPPIAQAVGLGAAVDYLSAIGMDNVAAHERAITAYALDRLTRGRRRPGHRAGHRRAARRRDLAGRRRRPPARRQPGPRLTRRRRPRRPPLRPPGLPAVRRRRPPRGRRSTSTPRRRRSTR